MSSDSSPTPAAIEWRDDARRVQFEHWLGLVAPAHGLHPASLRAASADASFRRYFRVDASGPLHSFIIMDAPPLHEDCASFVAVSEQLHRGGVHVPQVLSWEQTHGFLLLSDLGDQTYLSALRNPATGGQRAHELMLEALDTLVRLQQVPAASLAPYDEALQRREMDLFDSWYLERHLGLNLSAEQRSQLAEAKTLIVSATLAQPAVFVHRDFHSRNLMVSDPNPGVLDFQDAVRGPITYDLVSLLRDAYIPWDEELQIDYAARYWERARRAGLPVAADFSDFWRDFEWMGLQRQLKVLGIFARLAHRDGKAAYLDDMPVVWTYAHRACLRYRPFTALAALLEQAAGVARQAGYSF